MAAQDILDEWKAWTGEHLVAWNSFLRMEFFGGDIHVIRFSYNNGVGLPAPGATDHTYEGILFYEGPNTVGRLLRRKVPASFRGWGRLMQTRTTGTLTSAATSATDKTLQVRDRGQFPSTADFWVVVQDASWDTTNAETMLVTGGTGQGPGPFTVQRAMLGTTGVAHRGHATDPKQMSWVGLRGQAGDPRVDTPRNIYDTPSNARWVHLEIPADAAQNATFTFYEENPGSVLTQKQATPTDAESWSGETGELKFETPWWLIYRKTKAC